MSEDVAIIQEQILWWIEQGYTPREAMLALEVRGRALHQSTAISWSRVADWAQRKREESAWLSAEHQTRRAA